MTLITAVTFIALIIPNIGREPVEIAIPFSTMKKCLVALEEVQKTYKAAVCKDDLGVMYNSKTRM